MKAAWLATAGLAAGATFPTGCGVDHSAAAVTCAADQPPSTATTPPTATSTAAATFRGDAGLSGWFPAQPVRRFHGERWRSPGMAHPGRAFTAVGAVALITDERGVCDVDIATGRLVWAWHGHDPVGPPAVADGRVFVPGTRDPSITALSLSNGRVLWRRATGTAGTRLSGAFATFAIAVNGTVFVTESRGVLAIDAGSGAVRWEATIDGPTEGLAADAGSVFVVGRTGVLSALRTTDGSPRWQQQVATSAELPLAADGTVLVGRGDLVALDAGMGQVRWRQPADLGVTGVALVGGTAYVGTATSRLAAIDVGTGQVLWDFAPYKRAGFTVGPAVAGDVVYVGDKEGNLYAVDLGSHQLLWSYQADLRPGDLNPHDLPPMTTRREFGGGPLVVADGAVLISDVGGTVYVVD